jgi:hypothetical protein
MSRWVLDLLEITERDAARVGGKALRQAAMLRGGLPVPSGFCVAADAFDPADGGLSVEQVTEIDAAYRRLGTNVAVAVRSSAMSEDGASASFAGQFDTYLNVFGLGDVLEKIRACFLSLGSDRARAYQERAGVSRERRMGVLVQRLVPADHAGVLFTLNPNTGRENEMVIESAWGLGEALVSGRVTPDRIVVDTQDKTIVSRHVGTKRIMTTLAPAGIEETAVPDARQSEETLSDAELWALVDLGLRTQDLFGAPQDIEWASCRGDLYLVQSRPLTAIAFRGETTTQWTSANFREVWPRFMSPLSFSLSAGRFSAEMQSFFVGLGLLPVGGAAEWCRTFFGQGYWDVGAMKNVLAVLPGFTERAFDETVGLTIGYEGAGRVTRFTPLTIVRGLPVLLRIRRRYESVWREAESHGPTFLAREAELDAMSPASLEDGVLFEWVGRAVEFRNTTDGFALRTGFMAAQAQDDFRPLVDAINRVRGERGEQGATVSLAGLLTGLLRVGTAIPIFELWALASEALDDPEIATRVAESCPHDLLARLDSLPSGAAFARSVRAFLQRSRHLTQYNDELELPRWDEDPSFALTTLREFVAGGERRDGVEVQRQQSAARVEEEARALRALSLDVPWRWLSWRFVARLPKWLAVLDPRARFAAPAWPRTSMTPASAPIASCSACPARAWRRRSSMDSSRRRAFAGRPSCNSRSSADATRFGSRRRFATPAARISTCRHAAVGEKRRPARWSSWSAGGARSTRNTARSSLSWERRSTCEGRALRRPRASR